MTFCGQPAVKATQWLTLVLLKAHTGKKVNYDVFPSLRNTWLHLLSGTSESNCWNSVTEWRQGESEAEKGSVVWGENLVARYSSWAHCCQWTQLGAEQTEEPAGIFSLFIRTHSINVQSKCQINEQPWIETSLCMMSGRQMSWSCSTIFHTWSWCHKLLINTVCSVQRQQMCSVKSIGGIANYLITLFKQCWQKSCHALIKDSLRLSFRHY